MSTDFVPSTRAMRSPSDCIEGEAVVIAVVGNVLVEADRALHRHLEARILEHAERGGIRHVGVQDAARLRGEAMHGHMDVERRVLDGPAAARASGRSKSTTMKSLALTSDQCSPKGASRNRSVCPGTSMVRWLSMPSFKPKCSARR